MPFWVWLARLFGIPRAPAPGPAPVPAPVPPVVEEEPDDGPARVAAALKAVGCSDPVGWTRALAGPMRARGILTDKQVADFIANVAHESMRFARLVESLDYRWDRLDDVFGAHRFPEDFARRVGRIEMTTGDGTRIVSQRADESAIAERAYGGRLGNRPEGSGDGYRFRGHGLIQLTGRDNHQAAASAFGKTLDEIAAWSRTKEGAAEIAAWWWASRGLPALSERGDPVAVRRVVNGGTNGLEEVLALRKSILPALSGR